MTFEDIKKILKEHYGITHVEKETQIKKELGLSSFDLMNLICIVEERYGIELDEEKYRSMTTVGEMCDYVASLKGKK